MNSVRLYGWWLDDKICLEVVIVTSDALEVGLIDSLCFISKLFQIFCALFTNPHFQGLTDVKTLTHVSTIGIPSSLVE